MDSQAKIRTMETIKEGERFVDEIISAGEPWTDPDFGPNFKSLNDPSIDEAKPGFKKF